MKENGLSKFMIIIIGLLSILSGLLLAGVLLPKNSSRAQEANSANAGSKTNSGADLPSAAGKPVEPIDSMPTQAPPDPSSLPSVPTGSAPAELPENAGLNTGMGTPPVFEASGEYRYEPVGKRDPFRPYRDAKIGIGQVRGMDRVLEPLEKFETKLLQVVAIVWGTEKPRALIQDPESNIHSVAKGQRIGKNEGFIAEIREGEIVVVELFDLNGKVIKESVVLPIRK